MSAKMIASIMLIINAIFISVLVDNGIVGLTFWI